MMFKHDFYFFFRDKSPFSNWYIRNFKVREMIFNCVEQYMMYQKAILFGDLEIAKEIMAEPKPKKQKTLGRQVKGFNRVIWDSAVDGVLKTAIFSKFTQHRDLGELMLAIDAKEFVEASPYDGVYGVKLAMSDPRINSKNDWLGLNKLGRILTYVRNRLYAKRKGTKMENTSNHPEFIVFDLGTTFKQLRLQTANIADIDVLLPTIVTNVIYCLDKEDENLSRLDVYATDVAEQFQNDGLSAEDASMVEQIVKIIGHEIKNQILNINGYDENDCFDYELSRFEPSGALYLARRDPVGASAQMKEKTTDSDDGDLVGRNIDVYDIAQRAKKLSSDNKSETFGEDVTGFITKYHDHLDNVKKSTASFLLSNADVQIGLGVNAFAEQILSNRLVGRGDMSFTDTPTNWEDPSFKTPQYFEAGVSVMGEDKDYRTVPLEELKPSPYDDIINKKD